jgi:hypothetical protein
MDQDRKAAINAHVSTAAHERWTGFALEHGVSMSALIEVLADALPEGELGRRDVIVLPDLVVAARKVDAMRRRRSLPRERY